MMKNIFLLVSACIFLGCQSSANPSSEPSAPSGPALSPQNEEVAALIRLCSEKLIINQGPKLLFMSSARIWVHCHYNQEQILQIYDLMKSN